MEEELATAVIKTPTCQLSTFPTVCGGRVHQAPHSRGAGHPLITPCALGGERGAGGRDERECGLGGGSSDENQASCLPSHTTSASPPPTTRAPAPPSPNPHTHAMADDATVTIDDLPDDMLREVFGSVLEDGRYLIIRVTSPPQRAH